MAPRNKRKLRDLADALWEGASETMPADVSLDDGEAEPGVTGAACSGETDERQDA